MIKVPPEVEGDLWGDKKEEELTLAPYGSLRLILGDFHARTGSGSSEGVRVQERGRRRTRGCDWAWVVWDPHIGRMICVRAHARQFESQKSNTRCTTKNPRCDKANTLRIGVCVGNGRQIPVQSVTCPQAKNWLMGRRKLFVLSNLRSITRPAPSSRARARAPLRAKAGAQTVIFDGIGEVPIKSGVWFADVWVSHFRESKGSGMKSIVKDNWKIVTICVMLTLVVMLFTVGGCSTVAGFGKDLQAASEGIANMKSDSE